MKDVLFGYGTVGKATAKAFGIRHCIDWNDARIDKQLEGYTSVMGEPWGSDPNWIWICVPTPSREVLKMNLDSGVKRLVDGACDISIVERVVADFAHLKKPFVVRSTVIPGTAKRLMEKYGVDIVSFPEFLSEDTAEQDARHPWLQVIAGKSAERFVTDHGYVTRGLFTRSYFRYDENVVAELVKYVVNCWFGTQVVFSNQMYDVCKQLEKEAPLCLHDSVMKVLKQLPRVQHHLDVFHKGYRGYAGKCLPKDIAAMIAEYDLPLLRAIAHINNQLLAGLSPKPLLEHEPMTYPDGYENDYSLPLFEGST